MRLHAECRASHQPRARASCCYRAVLAAYHAELERSKQPGYVPPRLGADYDDDDEVAGQRQPVGHAPGRDGRRS
ncbi:MAG: hypothetical protein KatS3mg102_0053 [Planctomycetota bacterium]|nr:MAG: hypothetical protein KatS3mg102_0053 [Planctomycetota bacterium]